jgi:heme/copper-type cytochrome/quinol oxidase subunit 2
MLQVSLLLSADVIHGLLIDEPWLLIKYVSVPGHNTRHSFVKK